MSLLYTYLVDLVWLHSLSSPLLSSTIMPPSESFNISVSRSAPGPVTGRPPLPALRKSRVVTAGTKTRTTSHYIFPCPTSPASLSGTAASMRGRSLCSPHIVKHHPSTDNGQVGLQAGLQLGSRMKNYPQ